MSELQDLLAVLELEPTDTGFRASSFDEGHGVVFGGQLLAQSIVAGAATAPDKEVKSIHIVFARSASAAAPLELDVEVLHGGRAFASASVSIRQGDRLCTRATVLLHAPDPDLIRHAEPMPAVDGPATLAPRTPDSWWDIRVVGDVDISDPDAVGPADLDVWTRFAGAPAALTTSQALLGYASDGFLIGTAMRPHAGVGQAQAHVSISTTVLSHTLTFHEPFEAADWMLLAHHSRYAGRGRAYGGADVFTEQGAMVASYVQESMVRDFPEGAAPAAGERSKH